MNVIKFSHIYAKMQSEHHSIPKTALLMEVFLVDFKDLHSIFKEYDTLYYDKDDGWSQYILPEGQLIVLLLKTGDLVWTTMRRYTKEKFKYYKDNRSKEFIIEVTK